MSKDLPILHHYIGVDFVTIPFIWHYNDFGQPFPIYKVQKVNMFTLIKHISNNKQAVLNMTGLTDINTDFYIVAQYKRDRLIYNSRSDPREIYISYHSWLYYNSTNDCMIPPVESRYNKFRVNVGLFSINGELLPIQNEDDDNHIINMSVDDNLVQQNASIHKVNNVLVFSPKKSCYVKIADNNDNVVFLSIMKSPIVQLEKGTIKVQTKNKKSNCATLHVFRNVYDNNPLNDDYQKLIIKYF